MATKALAVTPKKVKTRVEPRHKWVLIREHKQEEAKTDGGVVVPGQDFFMHVEKGDPSSRGTVLAVSPGVDLNVGDLVVFTNFGMKLTDISELLDAEVRLVRDEEV